MTENIVRKPACLRVHQKCSQKCVKPANPHLRAAGYSCVMAAKGESHNKMLMMSDK